MGPEPETVAGRPEGVVLSAAEGRRILATWRIEHPDALYGALSPNGIPTTVPPGLGIPEDHVEHRSVLDLVVPEETLAVTEGFTSALRYGISITSIHMVSDPGHVVLLQYVDLREEFGVVLRLLARSESPDDAGRTVLAPGDLATGRPRLCFMTKDEVGVILAVDEATTLMLGWPASDMVGRRSLDFIHPDDHVRAIDNWMARRSNEAAVKGTVRLRYLRQDGGWLWLETSNQFVEGQAGTTVVNAQLIDISSEMTANEALRRSEELLRRVTETVPVGLFHIAADGEVLFVNPVARRLLGDRLPRTSDQLCALLAPGRQDELGAAIAMVLAESIERYVDLEIGPEEAATRSSCQVTLRPVMDHDRPAGVLGCVVDVTELRHIAYTDPLTGLANRRSIMQSLRQDLAAGDGWVAAVFIDLDRFKPVNDLYGHAVGDEALAAVAGRLQGGLRPTDRIGRLGGDEFLVVCPDLETEGDGLAVAERIRAQLDRPFAVGGRLLRLGASIGVSCGRPGASPEELVAMADSAMYRAKQDQGGPPVLLSAERQAG